MIVSAGFDNTCSLMEARGATHIEELTGTELSKSNRSNINQCCGGQNPGLGRAMFTGAAQGIGRQINGLAGRCCYEGSASSGVVHPEVSAVVIGRNGFESSICLVVSTAIC
jgi:hypothetical protein